MSTQFDMLYFHFHSVLCILQIFLLRLSLWPMDYSGVCRLISKCFIVLYWFQFDSIIVVHQSLPHFNSFKFAKVCFMFQNMAYVMNVPWVFENKVYSAVVGWRYQLDPVGWCIVQFVDSLADFPSSISVNRWEWSVEVPAYNCEFAYFAFQLYQCLLPVFWDSVVCGFVFVVVGYTHIELLHLLSGLLLNF